MSRRVETKRYPGVHQERLGIEVTTQCNCECDHCFARAGLAKPSSLSIQLVKAIIAEGYQIGYRHLHITGGEPLLWPGLFSALDYAFESGYQTVFLNTNGILITRATAQRLSAYKGLLVSVSLEGTEELHHRLRADGLFRPTLAGIETALDAGISLSIFSTACKSVLPELPAFAEKLFHTFPGISDLTLIQLVPVSGIDPSLSEELLQPPDLLRLIKKVSVLNLMGFRTRFLNNPLADAASKLLKVHWVPRSQPLYADGRLIVMASRDICLSHSSRQSLGKYQYGMLAKTLGSERYRQAVLPDEFTCPFCQYAHLCLENGMARPSEQYWGIQSDAYYCQSVLNSAANLAYTELPETLETTSFDHFCSIGGQKNSR